MFMLTPCRRAMLRISRSWYISLSPRGQALDFPAQHGGVNVTVDHRFANGFEQHHVGRDIIRLLVAGQGADYSSRVDTLVMRRQPQQLQQGFQPVGIISRQGKNLLRDAHGCQQPERHSLPVGISGVVAGRLDTVADAVSKVEHRPAAIIALVFRYHPELVLDATPDHRLDESHVQHQEFLVAGFKRVENSSPESRAYLTTSARPSTNCSRGSVFSSSGSVMTISG